MADGFRTRASVDLYAILAASTLLLLVLLVVPDASWLRIALGLPFVLFFPGYALVAALFPSGARAAPAPAAPAPGGAAPASRELGAPERVALSLGLSIAVVPLLGLILNYTDWGIRLVPVVLTVYLFTALMSGIALARRAKLPILARPEFAVRAPRLEWRTLAPLDKILVIAAALAVVAAAGATAYVVASPRPGEAFTEFYVLGPGGKAEGYPTKLAPNENGSVIIGIVNHEHDALRYTLTAWRIPVTFAPNATGVPTPTEGEPVALSNGTLLVRDGETHKAPYNFSVPNAQPWKVRFDLHKEGQDGVYRTLHLWVNAPAKA